MPENVATISSEALAQLTGFSIEELSRLSRAGYFPRAKAGQYEQNKAIPGCFKAYQDQTHGAGTLPQYQSMAECSKQTGIPRTILKTARKESAESFRAHRILLGPLLRWIFSKGDESGDWVEHLRKFQALREELKYKHDQGQYVEKGAVKSVIGKAIGLLFAVLDRNAEQLPAVLHGMDAVGVKSKLSECNESLKQELRNEFARL
jgi:hypothetical protein